MCRTNNNKQTLKVIPEDNELVIKLQKGDVEAFDLVYSKYAGKLYGFAFKYLKSATETEELVQSVFLKVWENQNNLRKESSFKSYLFTIAYNEICNLFKRRAHLQKFIGNQLIEKHPTSSETEEMINYNSILEQLYEIIAKLPERQRTIFLKSRQEGKTNKEIATELGLSSGTVDNYMSESLKFIRSNLQDKNFSLLLLFSLFLS
ncbi:MAG: RNA polymerase sigma-70 factor [Prolixibacteraceae bacterium]|nr:RNA polymerase sigma-70 factor [Prolixibacteraceae bacterium]